MNRSPQNRLTSCTLESPRRIQWGWGCRGLLAETARPFGRRVALFTGRSMAASPLLAQTLEELRGEGFEIIRTTPVAPEPGLEQLQTAMEEAGGASLIVAAGGGSVLDIAKGAAALSPSGRSAVDFFRGAAVPEQGIPLIALPTTSGAGSEVTKVCVLIDRENRAKASIRGGGMMPAAALVDPELTLSCPPAVTAASGADALVQAIESYTSRHANACTAPAAMQAARLAARWLPEVSAHPDSRAAREGMSMASLMAGQALNTSRLGLVHGLAHPVGAVTGAAHGAICGLLTPAVMRFNLPAAQAEYAGLAAAFQLVEPGTPDSRAAAALCDWFEALLEMLGIPDRLSSLGFGRSDVEYAASAAMPSGSTQANRRPVSESDARQVLLSCL